MIFDFKKTIIILIILFSFFGVFVNTTFSQNSIENIPACKRLDGSPIFRDNQDVESSIGFFQNQEQIYRETASELERAANLLETSIDFPVPRPQYPPSYGPYVPAATNQSEIDEAIREKEYIKSRAIGILERLEIQIVNTNEERLNLLGYLSGDWVGEWGISNYDIDENELLENVRQQKVNMENNAAKAKELANIAIKCNELLNENPNPEVIEDADRNIEEAITERNNTEQEYDTQLQNQADRQQEDLYGTPIDGIGPCLSGFTLIMSNCIAHAIHALFDMINGFLGIILTGVGYLFDFALYYTIVDFRTLAAQEFVADAWRISRDIANIFFIFIILWIGIGTILQLPQVNTQRMLTKVIIIALIINFSGVITRVIIDVSNVTAMGFYNAIATNETTGTKNLAQIFTKENGISSITEHQPTTGSPITAVFIQGFTKFFILLITMLVLLIAAVLLIIRAITLILLIITSPIAFVGYVVPFIENNVTKRWWKRMTCDGFFAPIFMFLLYISLTIAKNKQALTPNIDGIASLTAEIMSYVIILGLLLASVIIAKIIGCEGAAGVTNKGLGWGKGLAIGAAGGVAGAVGSRTVGRIGNSLQNAGWVQSLQASKLGVATGLGRVIPTLGDKATSAKFGSSKSYNDRIKLRQDEVTRLNDPAIKAKYIANLPKDVASKVYGSLSDREKADIELKAKDKEQKKSISNLRKNLSGEKAENIQKMMAQQQKKEISTKQETDSTGEKKTRPATAIEQAKSINDIYKENREDAQRVYTEYSDQEKANLEEEARKSNNQELVNMFKKLRSNVSGEASQKLNKELIEQQTNSLRKESGNDPVVMAQKISEIMEQDREKAQKIYNKLAPEERGNIETKAPTEEIREAIKSLKEGLNIDEKQKTDKSAIEAQVGVDFETNKTQIEQTVGQINRGEIENNRINEAIEGLRENIGNLTADQISMIDQEVMKEDSFVKGLNAEALSAIQRSRNIATGTKTTVNRKMREFITSGQIQDEDIINYYQTSPTRVISNQPTPQAQQREQQRPDRPQQNNQPGQVLDQFGRPINNQNEARNDNYREDVNLDRPQQ